MRRFLKSLFYAVVPRLSGGLSDRASILMYHSVSGGGAWLSISPAAFERQIAYLAKRYRPVFLSELVRRLRAGEDISNCVAVTFDDGYADTVSTALPILERHKVPASVFLITSRIGGSFTDSRGTAYPMLSEQDMREAHTTGLLEFLSHTRSHTPVPKLSPEALGEEIEGARADVARVVGENIPRIFAYPKGRVSDAARAYLAANGWAAVSTRGGLVRQGSDLLALPRNDAGANPPWSEFRAFFTAAADIAGRFR